jgi:rhodanese-related sulfurtransferase
MPGAEAAGHVTGAGTGVDPARSPAPCGARGTLCFPGQTCTQGHCVGTGALTPADLARALRSKDFLLLNVHAPAGIISGTDASISHEDPDQLARRIGPDPRARVVLYCRTSLRSGDALRKLRARGYQSVSYLDGGVLAWRQAGYLLTP